MPIGCRVTLRGKRMFEFLERFITLALPRVRDFRGLNPRSFDGRGNYSCGLSEQLVFPEIDPETVGQPQGMNIARVLDRVVPGYVDAGRDGIVGAVVGRN